MDPSKRLLTDVKTIRSTADETGRRVTRPPPFVINKFDLLSVLVRVCVISIL